MRARIAALQISSDPCRVVWRSIPAESKANAPRTTKVFYSFTCERARRRSCGRADQVPAPVTRPDKSPANPATLADRDRAARSSDLFADRTRPPPYPRRSPEEAAGSGAMSKRDKRPAKKAKPSKGSSNPWLNKDSKIKPFPSPAEAWWRVLPSLWSVAELRSWSASA